MAAIDNNLLTTDLITKEALRLLKNNLTMGKLVHRDNEKHFSQKVGDTISIRLPNRYKASDGRVLVKQPLANRVTTLTVDQHKHVGLEYTMNDLTLSIERFAQLHLASAMSQLADTVDRAIFLTAKKAFHSSGTPGTRPGAFIDFANAAAKQSMYGVPNDGMRRCMLSPFMCASLSDQVTTLLQNGMVKEAYEKGYKGPVANLDVYESQNLYTHTVGAHGGTPLVAGAIADGATSITTDGWTASVTGLLLEGDVFTLDGVYGVNPQGYVTTGILQEFVVDADVNSDGTGLATITFTPQINAGTATVTNAAGDSVSLAAYQNVTNVPADNTPINVSGVAGGQYEQAYIFHRDAIALAVVDIELPQSANVKSRASDPDSGLSIAMTQAWDHTEYSEITRLDILYGTKCIYPDLAMRLWGANLAA